MAYRIEMSEEFVFRKPDETRSEARDRLERGEDTRTLPSRDDDDDNGGGGSSGPSQAEIRRRKERKRRRRVEKELREADQRVEQEIQELTTPSGAVDITNLDRFRELSEKRTQIRNELRTDTPEPIILSENETLQQGAKEAATRKAERLSNITGKRVSVSRSVPQRQRGEVREQLLNLEKQGAITRSQRQRTERELQNQISQETITRGIRQFAQRRARQNLNPGFRPATSPEPIFGGNIPFVTTFTEVFRNPLSSVDETPEERQQRIITQEDIPGLENVGRSASEFTTRVRQRADTDLLREGNNVGLQVGRAALDVAEGAGEIVSRPFQVVRGVGETVRTAATQGVDEAISPDNEFLASRRLPFTIGAEAATLAVPATGIGLARRAARSQRRLPRFLDEARRGQTPSFTPGTVDPDTGQSQLVDQQPRSLDFRPVVDNGEVNPNVIGTRNIDEPRRSLFDPETERVTPLSKQGPLGSRLAEQRRLDEVQVTTKQELDPATASEELVGSQRDTPVDLTGDVRTVQELQKELEPQGQNLDSLVSQEEFILQDTSTGRTRTVSGDRVVDLLDTGRFTILDRKTTVRERTRQRLARQESRRRRQRRVGLQTSLQGFTNKRGQLGLPEIQRRRGRVSQANVDTVEPRGTLRPATPDIDSVDTFRPRRGFGVRPPRANPFGASLALQEQNGLLEPFDTTIPSLRDELGVVTSDVEDTAFTPVFDERSVQTQSDVFDTVQDQENVLINTFDTPTRSRATNTFRTPRKTRKKSGKSKRGKGKSPKGLGLPDLPSNKQKGGRPERVDVFIKRKGRFKKVNTGGSLSFDEGQDLGAKTVSESPARTFKLERSTSTRRADFTGDPDFFEKNKEQFRKSKSDRFGLVEKSKFAIDSEGELEGITFKGIRSNKF